MTAPTDTLQNGITVSYQPNEMLMKSFGCMYANVWKVKYKLYYL